MYLIAKLANNRVAIKKVFEPNSLDWDYIFEGKNGFPKNTYSDLKRVWVFCVSKYVKTYTENVSNAGVVKHANYCRIFGKFFMFHITSITQN